MKVVKAIDLFCGAGEATTGIQPTNIAQCNAKNCNPNYIEIENPEEILTWGQPSKKGGTE